MTAGHQLVEKVSGAEELSRCERIIERGLATFYEVGTALLKIREGRLYRLTHESFEAYCRERWRMSRPQAYRLIEAAAISENLSPIGDTPKAESQIRPLAGLQPGEQRAVWQQAVDEADGQPTAAKVQEVAKTLKQVINERVRERQGTVLQITRETEDAFSRSELAELREQMKENSAQVHRIMDFVRAIETLSHPTVPISAIAREICAMDTPDKNWRSQACAAESNLSQLAKEINQ